MENLVKVFIYACSIVISIVVIKIAFFKNKEEHKVRVKDELEIYCICSIIAILFLSLSIYSIAFLTLNRESNIKKVVSETEKEIVNLNIRTSVNGELNGSFFIGTGGVGGSINDKEYYYFYTKVENKYKLEKVLAENAELIEYDCIPKVVHREIKLIKEKKRTNGVISNLLKLDFNKEWETNISLLDELEYGDSKQEKVIIYIPKNSIFTNFNPNLE